MKIYSVNSIPARNFARNNYNKTVDAQKRNIQSNTTSPIAFKGDSGALKGMFLGALAGLGAATLVIATGGLAAVVAAGGGACVLGGGAGVGAQLGGIIGGIAEGDGSDSSNKDKKD